MVYSRKNNAKVSNLHESCFLLIYSGRRSSYAELLEKDGSVFIDHRNIQELTRGKYKAKNDSSPKIFGDFVLSNRINSPQSRRQHDFRMLVGKDCIS